MIVRVFGRWIENLEKFNGIVGDYIDCHMKTKMIPIA